MPRAIINGQIFDGAQTLTGHAVLIEDSCVSAIVNENELPTGTSVDFDLNGGTLIPGFVDLQVNGGGGVLFNDTPTVDGIHTIGTAHRQYGTTGFLPTLISTDFQIMRQAVRAVDEAIRLGVPGVLGIHLEGPFLNSMRRGAHDDAVFRSIDDEAIELLTSLKSGKTLITIAPELTSSATIKRLVRAGIVIAAGHSAADYPQTQTAIAAGVSGFTHLFNAMTPMHHREPGMAGAAISDADSWFGIIADGHHVHPAAFRVAVNAKYRGGAVLITDAMPPVGSKTDRFTLGGETIRSEGGRCVNAAGSLAGSDLNMIDAVNNAAQFADLDWFEAVRMASAYPANSIGVSQRYGHIRPGSAANLVAVDKKRTVTRTWIDGEGR